MMGKLCKRLSLVIIALLFAAAVPRAQAAAPLTALSGSFKVSYPGYDTIPLLVGLNDSSGLFGKDPVYIAPKAQQLLGSYTGIASNGQYTISLPDKPVGRPFDVTGGGATNANLSIFDIRLMSDVGRRGTMAENEDAIASSLNIAIDDTVQGGTMLVWAGDDKEQFPDGKGADGKLFTADDPREKLTAGWSLVNLDTQPFQISHEAVSTLNLTTTAAADVNDYTQMTCAQLIPTFLDRVQGSYPFTDLHHIDWTTLRDELIPQSQTAQSQADCQRIIREFANAIPDGHVDFNLPALAGDSGGSLGIRLDSTTDGQVVVTYVRPGSPAAQANIKVGAVITQWDGKAIDPALQAVVLQHANSSTPAALMADRLGDLPFGVVGTSVAVTYQNPGQASAQATMTRVPPQKANIPAKAPPDVTDNKLPSGIGYIRIDSFIEEKQLDAFDNTMNQLIADNAPGIIIDVRQNPGGLSQMSDAMASRFFDKGFIVGQEIKDGRLTYVMQVDPRQPIYHGPVAILVDRNTSSSADIFAYTFKVSKRATIVGNTPSSGMAGTVSGGEYNLPGDAFIQVPTGGFYDASGKFAVEGQGVAPDVQVPVTVQSLLSSKDDVLASAESALQGQAMSGTPAAAAN